MKVSERKAASEKRKEKIAKRYKGIDPSEIIVIPATKQDDTRLEERTLKVAGYVRVSTDNDEQKSSYELQVNEFTDRINSNPNWEFAGIYSDEGISGTDLSHRKGMLQMIEDAKAGKIQLILAKSIARFARNVVDCISVIDTLKSLDPPVGGRFDENNIYTLDQTGSLAMTIMATVAEEESRSKSFIQRWSIESRFSKGIFLTPELLGYDQNEDGDLIINPDEAETVKVMYYLYINGWSLTEIADLLTRYGRTTKIGNTEWSGGSLAGGIENERHCGDLIAQKTWVPNFKDHKSKKNTGQLPKYKKENHHDAIVSRDVYNAAMQMRASMKARAGNRSLPVLSVIEDGLLKGFVPVHKDWTGFSAEDYQKASESVTEETAEIRPIGKQIITNGYQRVRSDIFVSRDKLQLKISNGKMQFTSACVQKFVDVEYVELLFNPVKNLLAIRPCTADNPNAIRWARLKDERWAVRNMSCKGVSRLLLDVKDWTADYRIVLNGQYLSSGEGKLLLFSLEEETQKQESAEETVYVPMTAEDEESEKIIISRPSWQSNIGTSIPLAVSILEQHHYSGDWDVLRPASEIVEMNVFSRARLEELKAEAEKIIEGWEVTDVGA